MSIAADNFTVSNTETTAVEGVEASPRPMALGKFAVAFVATFVVGSALWAIGNAGVSQAIDNYYAKQFAAFTSPLPELEAAVNAPEVADDVAANAQ